MATSAEVLTEEDTICSSLPLGGYDYQFVEAPPKQFECPICLLTLRGPHLLSCCGVKICQSCIEGVKIKSQPCPKCRQTEFFSLLDKELQRQIYDLLVYCPHSDSGCGWKGELRHLDKHLSPFFEGECLYVNIECSHGCGQKDTRANMMKHEKETCSQLPLEVQIKILQERMNNMESKITQKYESEITHLQTQIQELTKTIQELQNVQTYSTTIPIFTHSILLLMPKIPNGNIPGVSYHPLQKLVKITSSSKEELEGRTQQFLTEFELLLPLLQKETFSVRPRFPKSLIKMIIEKCNRSYRSCYVINYDTSIELISINLSEYLSAKKLLSEKLSQKIQVFEFPTQNVECTLTIKLSHVIEEKVDLVIITEEEAIRSLSAHKHATSPQSTNRHSPTLPFLSSNHNRSKLMHRLNTYPKPQELTDSIKETPTFQHGVITPNSTGIYKSKHIICIANRSSLDQKQQYVMLEASLYEALSKARSIRAINSIALPARTSGDFYTFKLSFVIPALIESIYKFLKDESEWNLNDIRIILHDDVSVFDEDWFYKYGDYLAGKYNLK